MTGLIVGAFIAFTMLAYYLGKEHGSRMVFRMWEEAEPPKRKADCIHNVSGVVGYPKGDRYVCLDCGDTEPVFKKLEDK